MNQVNKGRMWHRMYASEKIVRNDDQGCDEDHRQRDKTVLTDSFHAWILPGSLQVSRL